MKFSEGILSPLGLNSYIIVKALCGAYILNIGFHEDTNKAIVIDYCKDKKLQRIAFVIDEITGDLHYVDHVIRNNTNMLSDVNKKLIKFSDGDWNDEFDFTQIEIISIPTERRYSFVYKTKEVLSLNIGEIKQLSDHIRNYFMKKIDNASELCMYLVLAGSLKKELQNES